MRISAAFSVANGASSADYLGDMETSASFDSPNTPMYRLTPDPVPPCPSCGRCRECGQPAPAVAPISIPTPWYPQYISPYPPADSTPTIVCKVGAAC